MPYIGMPKGKPKKARHSEHPMSCYPGQFEPWNCAIPFEPTRLDWSVAAEYNRYYRYPDLSDRIMLTNLVNCAIARAMIASRSGQITNSTGDYDAR